MSNKTSGLTARFPCLAVPRPALTEPDVPSLNAARLIGGEYSA